MLQFDESAHTYLTTNGYANPPASGLDLQFPYNLDDYNDSTTYDAPGAGPLPASGYTSVAKTFKATMYSMWKAYPTDPALNGDKTIWVPLRSYTWDWSGIATNGAPSAGWGLEQSNYPTSTATNVDATVEPVWTNVVQ